MKIYRTLAAIVTWFGLVLMFIVMTSNKSGMQLLRAIINYFSYFTILSNILVALSFTLSVVLTESNAARFFSRPAVRTGIAVYIIVTGVVYWLLLSKGLHPIDMKQVATVVLHLIVPVAYIADWIIFVPKGTLGWAKAFQWPAFPLAYAAYTLLHGIVSGFYPYPFINGAKLGYARVGLNCLYLLGAMVALGILLVAVDRRLGKGQSNRATAMSPESPEIL